MEYVASRSFWLLSSSSTISSSLSSLFSSSSSLLIILTLLNTISNVHSSTPPSVRTCEPIRLGSCEKLGYNVTGMPNLAGLETQTEAEQSFLTFEPLIRFGCSSQLRFFLCSVYVPMCTEKVAQPIGPCRPLCETVRSRCSPVLIEFGFNWPAYLNCSLFPMENNHQTMCMEGPGEDESDSWPNAHKIKPILDNSFYSHDGNYDFVSERGVDSSPPQVYTRPLTYNNYSRSISMTDGDCSDLKFHQQYYYVKNTGRSSSNGHGRCFHGCVADILFPSTSKHFTQFWIGFWSTFCLISSLFTMIMFCFRPSHFTYPERTIIFMGISYFIYGSTHLVSLMIGRHQIACYIDKQYNAALLIQKGYENGYCVLVFFLLYSTWMASLLWWLVLTVTWFASVGLQWTPERIGKNCGLYHAIVWGIPVALSSWIWRRGDIDADELTGNCNVGNHNREALRNFVIIPTSIILCLGCTAFAAGIQACMARRSRKAYQPSTFLNQRHASYQSSSEKISYNNLSSQTSHPQLIPQPWPSPPSLIEELGSSMIRLGIFALIYIAIIGYLLFTSIYEYLYRDSWYSASSSDLPNLEIMCLKIFMSFLVGIMTGIWIWMSRPFDGLRRDWKKPPLPLGYLPNHQVVHSSIAALDKRGRLINTRGGETTV